MFAAAPDVHWVGENATLRVIGTGALGGVGVYALNQSRAHAPGSVIGKRIMAGVGVGECINVFFVSV